MTLYIVNLGEQGLYLKRGVVRLGVAWLAVVSGAQGGEYVPAKYIEHGFCGWGVDGMVGDDWDDYGSAAWLWRHVV